MDKLNIEAERREFEAAVRGLDAGAHALDRDSVFGRDYVDEQIDGYWSGWKMARRAAPSSSADELPPLPPYDWQDDAAADRVGAVQFWKYDSVRQAQREAIAADRIARQGEPVYQFSTGKDSWLDCDKKFYDACIRYNYARRIIYLAAIQAAAPADAPQTPVAWALVSPKGGIKKLAITRASVESRMARWLEEWPGNTPRIRPLVYGDVGAPAEDAREQQPARAKEEGKEG